MKTLVVGATSELALACINRWSSVPGNTFMLAGRNSAALDELKADLSIRLPDSEFETFAFQLDLAGMNALSSLVHQTQYDLCLIAIGSNIDQERALIDSRYLADELNTNGVSIVGLAEIVAHAFEIQGYGTLGVIGSVAGDRGRAYNYAYGSAKSMVEKYIEGLQQRLSRTKIKVCLIKPGPTLSPLTVNHNARLATSASVASAVAKGMSVGKPKIYAPSHWKLVMLIVRNIPHFIFRKMRF